MFGIGTVLRGHCSCHLMFRYKYRSIAGIQMPVFVTWKVQVGSRNYRASTEVILKFTISSQRDKASIDNLR